MIFQKIRASILPKTDSILTSFKTLAFERQSSKSQQFGNTNHETSFYVYFCLFVLFLHGNALLLSQSHPPIKHEYYFNHVNMNTKAMTIYNRTSLEKEKMARKKKKFIYSHLKMSLLNNRVFRTVKTGN